MKTFIIAALGALFFITPACAQELPPTPESAKEVQEMNWYIVAIETPAVLETAERYVEIILCERAEANSLRVIAMYARADLPKLYKHFGVLTTPQLIGKRISSTQYRDPDLELLVRHGYALSNMSLPQDGG